MNVASPDQAAQNAPRAIASLVLGIVGLLACPLCGPVAWSLGHSAAREIDASGGRLAGRGLATTGKVLGIIGTVWLVVLVMFLVVGLLLLGADSDATAYVATAAP